MILEPTLQLLHYFHLARLFEQHIFGKLYSIGILRALQRNCRKAAKSADYLVFYNVGSSAHTR